MVVLVRLRIAKAHAVSFVVVTITANAHTESTILL